MLPPAPSGVDETVPPVGWRAPSHRADASATAHVDGDHWCTCETCTSIRVQRVRLLSKWMLDDLCAAELAESADNDNAIETARPPARKVA
jgi:hypothetical protein